MSFFTARADAGPGLLLGKGEDALSKFLKSGDAVQEIKTQQTVDGAIGREIVAGNRKITGFLPQASHQRNLDDGQVFQTTCCDDTDPPFRFRRIATDGCSHFGRDEGGRGSCVENHPENFGVSRSLEIRINDQKRRAEQTNRFARHASESDRVSGRQLVFGVGNQSKALPLEHSVMDFSPARRMGQNPPSHRGGGLFVHPVDGDQQPFFVESLSDLLDWLRTPHALKYIRISSHIAVELRAFFTENGLNFVTDDAFNRLKALLEAA